MDDTKQGEYTIQVLVLLWRRPLATGREVINRRFCCWRWVADIQPSGQGLSGTVADQAMGGPGGRPPPHWPKLRAGHGGVTKTRGQIFT